MTPRHPVILPEPVVFYDVLCGKDAVMYGKLTGACGLDTVFCGNADAMHGKLAGACGVDAAPCSKPTANQAILPGLRYRYRALR